MAAVDNYAYYGRSPGDSARGWAAVTPHNTNELQFVTTGLYVGTGGNVKLTSVDGYTDTFPSVPSGSFMPVRAKVVWSTGTTASGIVAMW